MEQRHKHINDSRGLSATNLRLRFMLQRDREEAIIGSRAHEIFVPPLLVWLLPYLFVDGRWEDIVFTGGANAASVLRAIGMIPVVDPEVNLNLRTHYTIMFPKTENLFLRGHEEVEQNGILMRIGCIGYLVSKPRLKIIHLMMKECQIF